MADYINETLIRLTSEQAESVNEQIKEYARANGKVKSRDINNYIKEDKDTKKWTYCVPAGEEEIDLPFVSEGNQNLITYPKKHEKYGQKVPFEDNYIALLRKWGKTADSRYPEEEPLDLLTDEQVTSILNSIEASSGSYGENEWIYSISSTEKDEEGSTISFDFRDRRIDDVNKPLEIAGGATIGLSEDPEMRSKFTIMGEVENQDGSTYGRLVDVYGDLKDNLDKWGHQIPNENYPKVYINRGEDRFNGETWVDGDSLTNKETVGREVIITLNPDNEYDSSTIYTLKEGKVLKEEKVLEDGKEVSKYIEVGTYIETGANFGLGLGTIESTKEIVSHSTISADHGLIIEDGIGDITDRGISKYYIKNSAGETVAIKFNDDGEQSRDTNDHALTIKHDGAKIQGWTHITDEEDKNVFKLQNGKIYYPGFILKENSWGLKEDGDSYYEDFPGFKYQNASYEDREYSNDNIIKECYFLSESEDIKGHKKDSHYGHWCIQKDGQEVYIIDEWPGFLYHKVNKQIDKIVSSLDTSKTLYLYYSTDGKDYYLIEDKNEKGTVLGIKAKEVKESKDEQNEIYKKSDNNKEIYYKLKEEEFTDVVYVVGCDEDGNKRESNITVENGYVASITSSLPERIVPQLHQVYQVKENFEASRKEDGARPARQYDNGFEVKENDYIYWTGSQFKKIDKFYYGSLEEDARHQTKMQGSLTIGTQMDESNTIGLHSLEVGTAVSAYGIDSIATGLYSCAGGAYSSAGGCRALANRDWSVARGLAVTADGDASIALGSYNHTWGSNSIVFGGWNAIYDKGNASVAGGYNTKIYSPYSFGFGQNLILNRDGRDSVGNSVVFGTDNTANKDYSTIFGSHNITDQPYQFLLGQYAATTQTYSEYLGDIAKDLLFAIGQGGKEKRTNIFDISKDGTGYFSGGLEVTKKSALRDKVTIGENIGDHEVALEVLKHSQFDEQVHILKDKNDNITSHNSLYNEGSSQFDGRLTIGSETTWEKNFNHDKGFCKFTGLEVFGEIRNKRIPEALYTKTKVGEEDVLNEFADKFFVNSSIATATATFRGSYSFVDYGFEEVTPTITEVTSLPEIKNPYEKFSVVKLTTKDDTHPVGYYIVLEKASASGEDNEPELYWARVKGDGEAGTLGELPYAYMEVDEFGVVNNNVSNKDEEIWYKKVRDFKSVQDAEEWLNDYSKKVIADGEVDSFGNLPSADEENYLKIYYVSTDEKYYRCGKDSENNYVWNIQINCATRASLPNLGEDVIDNLYYVEDSREYLICAAQSGTAGTFKWSRVSSPADKNDYCFVQIVTPKELEDCVKFDDIYNENGELLSGVAKTENNDYPVTVTYWRYKYYQTTDILDPYKVTEEGWQFEYQLNNSGFTQAQWDTINSGISSKMVRDLQDSIATEIKDRIKAIEDLTTNVKAWDKELESRISINEKNINANISEIEELKNNKMDKVNPTGFGRFELKASTEGTPFGYGLFENGVYEGTKAYTNKYQTLSEIKDLLTSYYTKSEINEKIKGIDESIEKINNLVVYDEGEDNLKTRISNIQSTLKEISNDYVTKSTEQTISGKKTFTQPLTISSLESDGKTFTLPKDKGGQLALAEDVRLELDWDTEYGASKDWETKGLTVSNTYCRKLGDTNLFLLKFNGQIKELSKNVIRYTLRAKINGKWAIPLIGSAGTGEANALKAGLAYGIDYDVDRGYMYLYMKASSFGTNYYCNMLCTTRDWIKTD